MMHSSEQHMQKVLMTTDTVGGVWTYAVDLCRALGPHHVKVVLASMGALPTEDQRRQVSSLDNVTLHSSSYRLEWMPDPWTDVRRAGDWLLNLEESTRPDVVHLNGYTHGALDWQAPVLIVAHSCVLSWWHDVKKEPLPDEWLTYAANVSKGLSAARMVVAPSEAMLSALRRHYRRLPPTRVIYNGRNLTPFHVGHKEPYILSAGRLWDEAKNLAALDQIADQLQWPVYVAGEVQAPGDAGGVAPPHVKPLGNLAEAAL